MKTKAKPFLKWAGGKGKVVPQLALHFPRELEEQEFTYIEPFVGGGAMLFHILQQFAHIKRVVINDINPYLAAAYRIVRDRPSELIEQLSEMENRYKLLHDEEARKAFYLNARDVFNEEGLDEVERTKLLIFLNRTCFNGLYRVNAKGKFNVPFGRYGNPSICPSDIILSDSECMNRFETVILNSDFEEVTKYIDNGLLFFYFDPPYRPLNATSSFNSYASEAFDDDEQIRLSRFCASLNKRSNIRWMLSNADCSAKNPDDTFFEKLYADYHIHRIFASRAINANPEKRGKLTELLIKNYE